MFKTTPIKNREYDAIVIGARCAGAATALLLARAGARVLIVDRDVSMGDTLSTHALMRPAVSKLSQWGVLDEIIAADTQAVTQTKFFYDCDVETIAINSTEDVPALYAPRRQLLDRVLRNAAVEAGAELHTATNFVGLEQDLSGRVVGARLHHMYDGATTIKADLVVGADGIRSRVAECAMAPTLATAKARAACTYTYIDGITNEGYRWYFADGKTAGLIPTNDGSHCFFASTRPEEFSQTFQDDPYKSAVDILSFWEPDLAAEIAERAPTEKLRRFPGLAGFIRKCAGPGWALVGDAGFFKDPCTAHGITDAFLDAQRLARTFENSPVDLSAYQIERDAFAFEMLDVTQRIASLDWSLDQVKSYHRALSKYMKSEMQSADKKLSFENAA